MEPNRRKKTEKSKRTAINNEEEKKVEELLQAAQDELLLKLSLDSHMSRVPPDYLHTDLDRRFQSLKSRPSLPISPSQSQKLTPSSVASPGAEDEELKAALGDELSARFAALKGSLFSSSSSSSSTNVISVGPMSSFDDDEEDEVEKLIRWAKDAARLDPSPPSDEDDDDDDDEEEDNHQHEKAQRRK